MLVTSIFSFSRNFFSPIRDKLHDLSHTTIVVCKYFQFLQNLFFSGKGLIFNKDVGNKKCAFWILTNKVSKKETNK